MEQAPVILVIILGLSAILTVYLASWARIHRKLAATWEFSFLSFSVAFYTLGYAVEITRCDLAGALTAIRLEYLGLSFIPAFTFLFVKRFVSDFPTSRKLIMMILIVPVITLLLVLSMDYHNLFYVNPRMVEGIYFYHLNFDPGVWYMVQAVYTIFMTAASIVILVINILRVNQKQRLKLITIAAGTLLPLVVAIVYYMGFVPGNIDPVPFGMVMSAIIFWYGLFKLGLFELVPAARELALDSVEDAFLVINRDDGLIDMNQAARYLPGACDMRIGELIDGENSLFKKLQPLLASGEREIEFVIEHPDHGVKYYKARGYPLKTRISNIDGIAILINDVTKTIGLMKKLSHYANVDSLTGVLNRRQLIQLAEQEMEGIRNTGNYFGVIMADLDLFKKVNDQYGHLSGDEVLKNVASCFNQCLREIDLLGRYGGEEFVIFLPNTDLKTSFMIAERLRKKLEDWEIVLGEETIRITASFGVYSPIVDNTTTIDDLLRNSDLALYKAKSGGRNKVVSRV